MLSRLGRCALAVTIALGGVACGGGEEPARDGGAGADAGRAGDAGGSACATHQECDDGVPCTVDECLGSACSHTPQHSLCNDGNPCVQPECTAGGCASSPLPDETPCAGGDGACTGGACVTGCATGSECGDDVLCTTDVCTDGACTNPPLHSTCNDGNECTADACTASGCSSSAVADGTPCASGDGACADGACVTGCMTDAHCNDGIECTDNTCQAGTCTNVPRDDMCDDGNECTAGACTVSGCEQADLPTGTPCSDGHCAAGACVECADAAHCDDGVDCTTDRCDAGACSFTPDDGACDDDNECTAGACTDGGCAQTDVIDGSPCSDGEGTCQQGSCAEPAGFRLTTVELQHPHAIADRTVCVGGCATVCDDFTFDDLYPEPPWSSFLVTEGINPSVQASVDDLTLSWVGLLSPLHQGDGFVGRGSLVEADCTSPTSCVPATDGRRSSADFTVRRSGSCSIAPAGELFEGAWPDERTTTLHAPAAGTDGCFTGEPMSLTVEVEIGGARVALPLTDARLAGRFVGAPASRIEDGLIVGFLSQAVADTIDVDVPFPGGGTVTVNLGRQVLPDNGEGGASCEARTHCVGPDARVTHDGECGWWFAFNFTADRIADASAF